MNEQRRSFRPVRASMPWLAALLLLMHFDTAQGAASPPSQPSSGPGGKGYAHGSVVRRGPYWADGRILDASKLYYIYEPANPMPASAPVVLFLHGWLGYRPRGYEAWINHIVKKGYTVVWARFDAFLDPFEELSDNAMRTWHDALVRINDDGTKGHVAPEKDSLGQIKTAIVGHSIGGYIAPILAARAADFSNGIPRPYAVASFTPGALGWVPYEDLGAIAPDTRMVVVVGDDDRNVCSSTAKKIWQGTPQIPGAYKDFLLVKSDFHGRPYQVANHFFPGTSGYHDTDDVDARDYYVTYKLSVALLNCVFKGVHCDVALGNGSAAQTTMGQWSDGVPMTPMQWIADPLGNLSTRCRNKAPGPN